MKISVFDIYDFLKVLTKWKSSNQFNATSKNEYGVQHSRWKIYPVTSFSIDCDIEKLYGKEFVPYISNKQPHSFFLARGSSVTEKMPLKIKGIKSSQYLFIADSLKYF